jgi:hypothetical protein
MLLLKILNVNIAPWNLIYNWKSCDKHRCDLPNNAKNSFQRCESFIAAFSIENEAWRSKNVYSAIGNWFSNFFIPPLQILVRCITIPITAWDSAVTIKDSHRDWRIFLKISLFNKYLANDPTFAAGSISLDSTFNSHCVHRLRRLWPSLSIKMHFLAIPISFTIYDF